MFNQFIPDLERVGLNMCAGAENSSVNGLLIGIASPVHPSRRTNFYM